MSTEYSANDGAAAERRYRRYNVFFWLAVAAIPLGIILPCVLSAAAYQVWGDEVSAPVALSALLWPIAGIAGALLVRGARRRARRARDLARLARQLGWRYYDVPPAEKFFYLKDVSFMADPHTQVGRNALEGQAGRWPLIALDYEYSYHYGAATETGAQTIAIFQSGFPHLPEFAIFPIGIMGRLENLLLGKLGAIPFPHEPAFHQRFAVMGQDPAAIVSQLNRPVIDLFLADPQLSAIVERGRLLVFRRLTYVAASDYQQFLSECHQLAELLSGN